MPKFQRAFLFFRAIIFAGSISADAQHRDYMSDEEIELVRDAQDIDLRIDTLSTMIDRRFTALGIDAGGVKIKPKNADKWGAEPTGTPLQLFHDIRQLLQKAADDIDDIAGRNEISQAQNKMEGKLFPKAVRSLAASALDPAAARSRRSKLMTACRSAPSPRPSNSANKNRIRQKPRPSQQRREEEIQELIQLVSFRAGTCVS